MVGNRVKKIKKPSKSYIKQRSKLVPNTTENIEKNKQSAGVDKEKNKQSAGVDKEENKGSVAVGKSSFEEEKEEMAKVKKEEEAKVKKVAVQILKKLDPTGKIPKKTIIRKLKAYLEIEKDMAVIRGIEYLLDSLENLEERLDNLSKNRKVQDKKIEVKELEKDEFNGIIKLDLAKEDREPDENDRIFLLGKKIFSGNNQKYIKPKATAVNKFKKFSNPKKNNKLLEKYNI